MMCVSFPIHRRILATAILALQAASTFALAAPGTFHVSRSGNDQWSGTLPDANAEGTDGPFATLPRAQAAARGWRAEAKGVRPECPVIEVRGGTYPLEAPLVFTPEDSGLICRAYRDESVVLSGGRRVTGWAVAEGRWTVRLPEVTEDGWHFTQLFVNDQRRFRPRLPASGYYHIAGELEPSPQAEGRGFDRFRFEGEQVRPDWANLNDVEALVFHQWSMSRLPIQAVDAATGTVQFFGRSPSTSAWGKFAQGHRFLLENVREALGQPGQWYLDRASGELTYLPRPGETPENTVVVAPRLTHLVRMAGNVAEEAWVANVLLEGLTFAHAAWPIPRTGQAVPQAEMNLDGALSLVGARDVVLRNCAVRHVGAYAIAFGMGCRDNLVEGCELFDLGAGGVKIGAAGLENWGGLSEAAAAPEAMVSHHTVRDCVIAHSGRLHPAAIGIWIGHSPHNVVEHNLIHDLYYSATSIGWIWGYAPSHAHHNRVLYNHMHTIGQGVLSDMGAVYTLGLSPGTEVSHNLIHDVDAFDYGGWGLYTDEGSTGVTLSHNVVYRTKTGGFHQHYGRDNRVVNNILAFSRTDQLQRSRVEDHVSFIFERNLVLYDRGELMGKAWGDDRVVVEQNLYWNTAGPVAFPGGRTLDIWRNETGHDRRSLVADPRFADAPGGDFSLHPDSPAFGLGFEPVDGWKAGPRVSRRLTARLPPVPRAFD